MKTKKNKKAYLAIGLVIMSGLFSARVMAQNYNRHFKSHQSNWATSNHFILGLEGGVGTTSYKFKSDIPALNQLAALSEGWGTNIVFGSDEFRFRAGLGKYHFKKSADEAIDQALFTTKFNFSPANWFGKSKYFRVYFISGVDYNVFRLNGINVPKPKEDPEVTAAKAKQRCKCTCPSGPPADPGAPPSIPGGPPPDPGAPAIEAPDQPVNNTQSSTQVAMVKIKKAQINGGLGLEFNTTKNGRFFRMFGEAYYGLPLKEIIDNLGLSNTSISGQLVFNFGIGIGISR